MRLDKYLSRSGAGTRTEVREAIRKGSVTVNGIICRLPGAETEPDDAVRYKGRAVKFKEHIYLMLNKPCGFISAVEDKKEKTVISLIGGDYRGRKLSPAGRLDKDAEGLMILTDDGGLIHRIISPNMHAPKKYYVRTEGIFQHDYISLFGNGLDIGDGIITLPAELEAINGSDNSEFYLTIQEGKFHQVKRMFASVGMKVVYLKRISIKGVELDDELMPGMYRELYLDEIEKLRK